MCVVKAFAYGSDPLIIGNFLEENNVDYLAVAYTNEGVKLRSYGIKLPILILHPQIDDFDEIIFFLFGGLHAESAAIDPVTEPIPLISSSSHANR